MSFEQRVVVVSLAAFAVGGALGALAVPWLAARLTALDPSRRARLFLRLRGLPAVSACGAMALALASFALFEPRTREEATGLVLAVLAGVAAALVTRTIVRVVMLWRSTHLARRIWMTGARRVSLPVLDVPAFAIDSEFPVVAAVGVFRPILIVARSVLAACTHEELRAILAHERHHLTRRDNIGRAWFAVAPDLLGGLPIARRLFAAWQEASEEAADDASAALGPTGRVALAQALVRVARLAPPDHGLRDLPVSALYRGEDLANRVRRLLAPPSPADVDTPVWRERLALVTVVIGCGMALHLVHGLFEAAVTFLP